MSEIEVRDEPAKHRFELLVDGEHAGLASYLIRDNTVIVTHSEVSPHYRGHGYANELASRSLDQLREQGRSVVPACPFYAKFVSEHHDWDDILVDY